MQDSYPDDQPRGGAPKGPLAGLRVVELSTVIMAPFACQILGDLGANVIKVEAAGGDHSRVMGGGPHPELSGVALNLHRNKRSVQLDLSMAEGREAFERLLDTADIFVTNFRPKALKKLNLDYETVGPARPRLVYCEAHGFSLDSGEADLPAYDDIIQAATGLPSLSESATETMNYLPTIVGDKVAGLTITYSILAALIYRTTTGLGQRIEIPMFRRPHKTLDGHIAMLPYSDKSWSDLYHAVGHEHELDDPWFVKRLENPRPVYASLAKILLTRTSAEWLDLADKLGIPAGPVPTMDEIVDDPAQHRGVLSDHVHPVAGIYRQIAPPAKFDRSPAEVRKHAPLLGQDTIAVLAEIGLSPEEIKDLLAKGAATVHA
jgi:crotonobetainyl-CoA:carnitine CoA-transferase CaiB-like acyl-CoA transferase